MVWFHGQGRSIWPSNASSMTITNILNFIIIISSIFNQIKTFLPIKIKILPSETHWPSSEIHTLVLIGVGSFIKSFSDRYRIKGVIVLKKRDKWTEVGRSLIDSSLCASLLCLGSPCHYYTHSLPSLSNYDLAEHRGIFKEFYRFAFLFRTLNKILLTSGTAFPLSVRKEIYNTIGHLGRVRNWVHFNSLYYLICLEHFMVFKAMLFILSFEISSVTLVRLISFHHFEY